MSSVSIALAEIVLSGQAVKMHNPQIAQLHKLCMLILAVAQALGFKGPKVSTVWVKKLQKHASCMMLAMLALLAAFCISACEAIHAVNEGFFFQTDD